MPKKQKDDVSVEAKQTFVENLNKLAKERGITQDDIVKRFGLTASTVSDWFRGENYPRVDNMQRLAGIMDVRISDLIDKPVPETEDELDKEVLDMFKSLPPEKKGDAVQFLRFLKSDSAKK
jgi:transcriptional regulator with XRE-family HTH domain